MKGELPGILAWAVRGCLAWQEQGLGESAAVTAATDEYRRDMDLLANFLEDRCVVETHVQAPAKELYAQYENWCRDNDEEPVKQRTFGRILTERGFARGRGIGGRIFYFGLAPIFEGLKDLEQKNGKFPIRAAPATLVDNLEQRIRQAPTWRDLEMALECAQTAFERGELDADQVEALAVLAQQEARCMPEQFAQDQAAAGEKIIYVTDLLADDGEPDTCPCCGRSAWWTKTSGQRICGICHPDPKRHERRLPLLASTPGRR